MITSWKATLLSVKVNNARVAKTEQRVAEQVNTALFAPNSISPSFPVSPAPLNTDRCIIYRDELLHMLLSSLQQD